MRASLPLLVQTVAGFMHGASASSLLPLPVALQLRSGRVPSQVQLRRVPCFGSSALRVRRALRRRGPPLRPATVARRVGAGALRSSLWAAASALALLAIRRKFYDASHVKRFITSNTNIKIIDGVEDVENVKQDHDVDDICWFIKDDAVVRRMLLPGGNIALGETFMDGWWGTNNLRALMVEFIKLERMKAQLGWRALPFLVIELMEKIKATILPSNTLRLSRKNITYHYDIDDAMFRRQLGPAMQYTCAYFHQPGLSLDEAQLAKMRLVAHKLDLKPGMKVIDLGCGYGALAYLLATEYGVHVTGVTLSDDQVAYAKENYAHPNVDIRLQDYRTVEGVYDRVYSVGIFEHIGRKNYKTYFDKCYDMLAPDGIMFIHTLGWGVTGRWNPNTFMFRYIWPGAEMPHASHFTKKYTDRWHLEDWQNFGRSYGPTAQSWYDNLQGTPEYENMDVRFRRMWKYYLLSGAASVDSRKCSVWQLVFTKTLSSRPYDCHHIRAKQNDALPTWKPWETLKEVLLQQPPSRVGS